jgi:hypothetical protein
VIVNGLIVGFVTEMRGVPQLLTGPHFPGGEATLLHDVRLSRLSCLPGRYSIVIPRRCLHARPCFGPLLCRIGRVL